MRADLHVHTWHSDGWSSPTEVVIRAADVGLDCIAITDHDTMAGVPEAVAIGESAGVHVIPGIEVSSRDGHILGIGVDKPIRKGLSASATIDAIHDAGGVAIAAHPFTRNPKGVGRKQGFDAIEVWNGSPVVSWWPNVRAIRYWLARTSRFAAVANSDCHAPITLGCCYTTYEGDVLTAIRERQTSVKLWGK